MLSIINAGYQSPILYIVYNIYIVLKPSPSSYESLINEANGN
jgi:hypothetical protein